MYSYLEKSLLAIDFMKKVSHAYWMSNIRNFFSRIKLTSKDANIIRGVSKKFLLRQNSTRSSK
jgi:tRNA/rRNA methyltransferase